MRPTPEALNAWLADWMARCGEAWSRWARECVGGDAAWGEDVLSEALFALASAKAEGGEPDHPSAWMMEAIRRRARSRRRKEASQRRLAAQWGAVRAMTESAENNAPSNSTASSSGDRLDRVLRTLPLLTDRHRRVLEWRFLEGLDHQEIATRLACPKDRVRHILYEALRKVRSLSGQPE